MTAPVPASAAEPFFERGRALSEQGDFDDAIEMFLRGLALDLDNVDAHQELRDIALKRKAGGGKPLGMFKSMRIKRRSKDDKQNMLNAERQLAYDPGHTDFMLRVVQAALQVGCNRAADWMHSILRKALREN